MLVTWGANPVYSILTLITTSFSLGLLLMFAGLEFVPFLVVLIYIGAVAVLFLFVVMMINFDYDRPRVMVPEVIFFWWVTAAGMTQLFEVCPLGGRTAFEWCSTSNFVSLGSALYGTLQVQLVWLVGLVLFVAMIGAISLTYISGENYRTQHVPTQTRRDSSVYRLQA